MILHSMPNYDFLKIIKILLENHKNIFAINLMVRLFIFFFIPRRQTKNFRRQTCYDEATKARPWYG